MLYQKDPGVQHTYLVIVLVVVLVVVETETYHL